MSVLSGMQLVEQNIVEAYHPSNVQPAGYDLRIDSLKFLPVTGMVPRITVDNKNRVISDWEVMRWNMAQHNNKLPYSEFAWLHSGRYGIQFVETINIPSDCAGLIFPRSSLLRSDCTITTAVWDSGYSGNGFGYLIVNNKHGLHLERYAAVAQLVVIKLDSVSGKLYDGVYQHEGMRK